MWSSRKRLTSSSVATPFGENSYGMSPVPLQLAASTCTHPPTTGAATPKGTPVLGGVCAAVSEVRAVGRHGRQGRCALVVVDGGKPTGTDRVARHRQRPVRRPLHQ